MVSDIQSNQDLTDAQIVKTNFSFGPIVTVAGTYKPHRTSQRSSRNVLENKNLTKIFVLTFLLGICLWLSLRLWLLFLLLHRMLRRGWPICIYSAQSPSALEPFRVQIALKPTQDVIYRLWHIIVIIPQDVFYRLVRAPRDLSNRSFHLRQCRGHLYFIFLGHLY